MNEWETTLKRMWLNDMSAGYGESWQYASLYQWKSARCGAMEKLAPQKSVRLKKNLYNTELQLVIDKHAPI